MDSKKLTLVISFIIISLIFYWIFAPAVGDIFSSFIYLVAVLTSGLGGALIVGIVTPLLGQLFNLLEPAISQVLFTFLIGNILLVAVFKYFSVNLFQDKIKTGMILGVFIGSILRAVPVTLSANRIEDITRETRELLGFPQFFAPFLAGIVLVILYAILNRFNKLPALMSLSSEEE